MKEVKLDSGSELKITLAPHAESWALFQAVLEEIKGVKLDPKAEVDVNLFKDLFCSALSSKKIESCLTVCMRRCLYNGHKIIDSTFEPAEAREDFIPTLIEVAKENLAPFTKTLTAQFSANFQKMMSGFQ